MYVYNMQESQVKLKYKGIEMNPNEESKTKYVFYVKGKMWPISSCGLCFLWSLWLKQCITSVSISCTAMSKVLGSLMYNKMLFVTENICF